MREDAAVSHRNPGPFRALGLTLSHTFSVAYRRYQISLAGQGELACMSPSPSLSPLWLSLPSAKTQRMACVAHSPARGRAL